MLIKSVLDGGQGHSSIFDLFFCFCFFFFFVGCSFFPLLLLFLLLFLLFFLAFFAPPVRWRIIANLLRCAWWYFG